MGFAPSSESNCVDADSFVRVGKELTCDWAAEKFSIVRCRKKADNGDAIDDLCPSVCNYRCTCTNAKEPFEFRDKWKICKKVKDGQCLEPAGKGLKQIVADFCPKKCKSCYAKPLRIPVPAMSPDE